MATDLERLVVQLSADVKGYENAMKRAQGVTDTTVRKVNREFTVANQNITRGMNQQRAAATNLSFQINDLVTQISSGTSPMRAFAQQAGQITQALQGLGSGRAIFGALGGAIGGLLNPISLATLAIGGLTAAAIEYFSSTDDEADKTKPKLEEHIALVKRVVEAWGSGAPQALTDYVDEIERLTAQQDRLKAMQQAQDALLQSNRDRTAEIVAETEKLFSIFDNFPKLAGQIEPAREVLKGLAEDGKITREEADLLVAALSKLTIPGARRLIDEINSIKDSLVGATNQANSLGDAMRGLGPLGGLGAVTSEGGQFGVSGSRFGFGSQPQSTPRSAVPFSPLPGIDLNRHIQLAAARQSISRIESGGNYRAIGSVTASGDRAFGKYQVMGSNIADWTKQAIGTALTSEQFLNNPEIQDRVFDHIFGGYIDRFGMEGASQAWFGGPGAVGKTGRQDMHGTSVGEYGKRFTAGLGEVKDAWAGVRDVTTQTTMAVQQQEQAYQALGSIATTALNGIASALSDGKLEGEELLQILIQIVQQMLTMPSGGGGLGGLFGGGGGGGGGLLGGFLIPGILHKGGEVGKAGYGHGRRIPAAAFVGAPRYHNGGVAGRKPWGPNEMPTLLEKGELIVPRGARVGSQAVHVTVGVSADNNGNLMPFVESVSERKAAQVTRQGIGAYDKQLNRTIGGKVANAQARQL